LEAEDHSGWRALARQFEEGEHFMVARQSSVKGESPRPAPPNASPEQAGSRSVELKRAPAEAWRARAEDRIDEILAAQAREHPEQADDFDIAAWFAVEEEDEHAGHERCIAECWYG
jgi:hypothetical protein